MGFLTRADRLTATALGMFTIAPTGVGLCHLQKVTEALGVSEQSSGISLN